MKKLFWCLCVLLFASSSVYGLSCAWFSSFDDLLEEAEIAFVGTVTNRNYFPETSEYCQELWNDVSIWTYEFRFDVEQELSWSIWSTAILQREVTDINCTWWWACSDMIVWETYVVLTEDWETLAWWLCSPCPYMPASEYYQAPYDPATDPACLVYNDGCNTCHKWSDGLAECTKRACFDQWEPFCMEYVQEPEPAICICTMQYDPVCGVDGNTYGNACGAWCENIEIAYSWECQFGEPGWCERWYSGQVCGADGMTYEDVCDLESEWVLKAYDGACVPNSEPLWYVEAPWFCTSWYDGCNECGVANWILTFCTERACFTMNRSKCTAFDFMYLTLIHERIIDDVVGKRSDTATEDDRERVIEKVQAKIADINHTLSVSSFVQWSEELKWIQFLLEILWKIDSVL